MQLWFVMFVSFSRSKTCRWRNMLLFPTIPAHPAKVSKRACFHLFSGLLQTGNLIFVAATLPRSCPDATCPVKLRTKSKQSSCRTSTFSKLIVKSNQSANVGHPKTRYPQGREMEQPSRTDRKLAAAGLSGLFLFGPVLFNERLPTRTV